MNLLLDFKQKQKVSWTWKEGLLLLTVQREIFGDPGDPEESGLYLILIFRVSLVLNRFSSFHTVVVMRLHGINLYFL